MIGETIDERYTLIRLIGEGAMGAVYEAAHVNTGRIVAIKLIQQFALSDTDVYARFEREARVAGAIDSRHVASVLDSGRDKSSGLPYMALEMLRGEDLGSYLGRKGALPPSIALRLLTQACTGLAKAHAAEVVHRDIKPANIFLALDEDGERVTVKLLDFGIAKFRPSGGHGINLTQTGKMLGTPRYMSPEQAQGEKDIDFRTDVWSLGSVLYEALTGRPPHNEPEHIGKLIFSICSTTPPAPTTLVSGLSAEIDQTVMKCLATSREHRYTTARGLLEELETLTPDGADVFADELGLERTTATERPTPSTTRRVSKVSRASSQRLSRSDEPVSQPDAKIMVDLAEGEPSANSTMFAADSSPDAVLRPRPPSRTWLYAGLGIGATTAMVLFFALGTNDVAPGAASATPISAPLTVVPTTATTTAPPTTTPTMTSTVGATASASNGADARSAAVSETSAPPVVDPAPSSRAVQTPAAVPSSNPIVVKTAVVPHATAFE